MPYAVVAVRSVCSDVHRDPLLRAYARRLVAGLALGAMWKAFGSSEDIEWYVHHDVVTTTYRC